jgi:hypothetical protein
MYIYDLFLNNFYIIIPLIILSVFLVWSAKVLLGRTNKLDPPFDWRDRFGGFGSSGGIGGADGGGGFGHFGDGNHAGGF